MYLKIKYIFQILQGMEWIRSEQFLRQEKLKQKEREKNNPMKACVLKFDHFENIHRLWTKNMFLIFFLT